MSCAVLLRCWVLLLAIGFEGGGFGAGKLVIVSSGGFLSLFWIEFGAAVPDLAQRGSCNVVLCLGLRPLQCYALQLYDRADLESLGAFLTGVAYCQLWNALLRRKPVWFCRLLVQLVWVAAQFPVCFACAATKVSSQL
ncbi:hypothetical protein Nepgr_020344 [Nepenthes gracilis]|uniref:Uncharacterized protein n=1 Tax=Nepenthes gracilis TaxID=150966 RepID=A0AAD3SVV6_NEPGR|nr:hypothetical protein Nepgr_020344 [Nepenthes gracilis]